MAALAAALLLAGGGGADALSGLTNGAILAATPFGILMVPMCYGLYKTLKADYSREEGWATEEAVGYAERRPDAAPDRSPGPATPQQMTAEDPKNVGSTAPDGAPRAPGTRSRGAG